MNGKDDIVANAIRRVEILEEIDKIKQDQIAPLKKQLLLLDRNMRVLVFERDQDVMDFEGNAA